MVRTRTVASKPAGVSRASNPNVNKVGPLEPPLKFWQELDEERRYFVDLVNLKLMTVTRVRGAAMRWTTAEEGTAKIAFTYGVVLRGWPQNIIPFGVMPAHIRKMSILAMLIRRFETGLTWFEKVSKAKLQALAKREGYTTHWESGLVVFAERIDARQLRPVETRSKVLRKFGVKTSRKVNGRED